METVSNEKRLSGKNRPKRERNRFERWCKSNEFVLISFFTAVVVSLVFWIVYGINPLGDMSVMRMDMYHQYGPLLGEYFDRLTGSGGLIYSWHSGGGGNFLGNFYNYLSSPISLFVLLFGHKHVPQAIAFIILLKGAFASANFTYYLKKSSQFGQHNLLTAGFGLLYAFSGYFVAYYWNFMWLDGYMLLPLIILGLERIVDEGKPWLYTISFSVLLFATYYMAYMVAIFMVLYFLVYYFGKYPAGVMERLPQAGSNGKVSAWEKVRSSHFVRALLRCIGFAILAAALAAFALLPTYFSLKNCSATSGTFPSETSSYFNFFDFLINHTDALTPTIRSSEAPVLPNVFCGIGTVVLAVLFFYIKSVPLREKISDAAMLAALYASFNLNKLNYIWHGFHFPNDLPYRQSFVYVFFLLIMAFKALSHIRELKLRDVLSVGLVTALFVAVAEKVGQKNIDSETILITLIFLALYIVCIAMLANPKFRAKTIAAAMFCVMFAEVIISDVGNFETAVTAQEFNGDYKEMKSVEQFIDQYNSSPEFYRTELTTSERIMNPSWYGYNGISEFSSMAYEKSANLQFNLGLAGNYINSYIYSMQTPVYNAMFDLKYLVNNDRQNVKLDRSYWKKIGHSEDFDIYQNQYALPLAYAVSNRVQNWDYYSNNPFHVQENYWERATGVKGALVDDHVDSVSYNNIVPFTEDISSGSYTFQKEDPDSEGSFTFTFTADKTQNYYLYVSSRQIDKITVTSNDSSLNKTDDCSDDQESILDLGVLKAGTKVNVSCPVTQENGTADIYIASLNDAQFRKGYQALSGSGAMKVTSYDDTHVEGSVTMGRDQFLYTSINYDTGWDVYIDGEKANANDLFRVGGALLGVKVPQGKHQIRFVYHEKGQKDGIMISLITLLLILLFAVWLPRRRGSNGAGENPDADGRPFSLYYPQKKEEPYTKEDELYDSMFKH